MVSLTGSVQNRQAHRADRRGHAQAGAPRARREGARGRVRRREPRGRPGDDRRHRLLQRRAGLHGGHARAGRGSVYDDVVSGLAGQAKGLVIGDTLAPETTLGPVNSARQRERVEGFSRAQARSRGGGDGRLRARPAGLLPGAHGGGGASAGRRDDPARDLRARDHRAAVSQTRSRRSPGRTPPATGWPPRCGRATWGARCACRRRCGSGACGSTTTYRSSRRCPTAASRSPATERT